MIESTEQTHGRVATGEQKSDAQWIEVFAPSFVTQRHLMVKTRGVTAKEGTVTQINPDSVHAVRIHGAGHQIPFGGIEEVTRIGEAEMPLGPLATRHSYDFAGFMARGSICGSRRRTTSSQRPRCGRLPLRAPGSPTRSMAWGYPSPYEDITDILSVGME